MFEMVQEGDSFPHFVGTDISFSLEKAYRALFDAVDEKKGKYLLHQAATSDQSRDNILRLLVQYGSHDGDNASNMIHSNKLRHLYDLNTNK